MDALKMIAADSIKENRPQFEIGDTVRVHVNIREGERERVQMFEGTVIAKRGMRFRNLYRKTRFLRRRRGKSIPGEQPQR